ncbi:MAG: anti-sigma factor family protein [Gemmataceae bacterium]
MSMVCREVLELLLDYVDGELPAEQQQQFERHLCGCLQCYAFLETYRATIRLTRALPAEAALPAELEGRLRALVLPGPPEPEAGG